MTLVVVCIAQTIRVAILEWYDSSGCLYSSDHTCGHLGVV